ncbi:tRNA pseudouridine(38-40) synthase TruA [Corynebacterium mendelii]|uniref:tRNA pseudouridine synthase A n=1 Tax=Corynebacterium mendelii TaxID=2765362 RepID=A0A939E1D7_9CORY|nr:tRNA pseudouridine(38-40) synthase TruA [Corynebacterium mendelii]
MANPAKDCVRLRFTVAYDGTAFNGWAKQLGQDGVRTVQATIEQALELVFRRPCPLTVAGRTDAGVHATGQVAHADVPREVLGERSIGGDPANLVRRLSRLVPDDIQIRDVAFAPEGFDARFSALRRHYIYRVTTNPGGVLPTRRIDTAAWPKPVDLDRMVRAVAPLVGLHDFAAFSKYRPGATTVRDLQRFDWVDVSTAEQPQTYQAYVSADAFTWSMVRSLVGASLAVGQGRRAIDFMAGLLDERSRSPLVPVAPAAGLTLVGVDYPADSQLAQRADETRGIRVLPGEEHRAAGKGCPDTNPFY